MISQGKQEKYPTARPLSYRAIVLGAVFVLGIAVTSGAVLWCLYHDADPRVQLDAIRTASAITVAAGGAAALLLAARRQRSTEQTLEHQRDVAQATERDAAEQRITELYTRAVDQLGAEKAPVRLGGLHALERLAQTNPPQRQTIVDVICAYLRMPYTPPDDQALGEDAHTRHEERRQELQVRLTAQRILSAHLKPETAEVFWDDIDLDLTEAHLHQFDLTACHIRSAQFGRAMFAGYAGFGGAEFAGDAWFGRAEFAGDAWFGGAEFAGDAGFYEAKFAWTAGFYEAKFAGDAGFRGAEFAGDAWFGGGTEFAGDAWFGGAEFAGDARFHRAKFAGDTTFHEAKFAGDTWFTEAEFAGNTEFDGARVAASRRVVLPTEWTTRAAQPGEGEEEGWRYVVREEDSSEQHAEAPGDGPA